MDAALPSSRVLVTGVSRGPMGAALHGKVVDTVLALQGTGLIMRFTDGTEVKLQWHDDENNLVHGTVHYEFRRYDGG